VTVDVPYDSGLAAERTLLSWRRTCLAVGVAAAMVARLTAPSVGGFAILLGVTTLAFVAVSLAATQRRYAMAYLDLRRTGRHHPRSGALVAVAGGATLVAALAIGYLVQRALSS
jgi:uncharacterized membrane protein YidH (DUF202 family)